MVEDRDAVRERLSLGLMEALVDQCTMNGSVVIPAREAAQALLFVMAAVIAGTEASRTRKALRETSEALARDLRNHVLYFEEAYRETGERPFDKLIVAN